MNIIDRVIKDKLYLPYFYKRELKIPPSVNLLFTSDEHYFHLKAWRQRGFSSEDEMSLCLINNHNNVTDSRSVTIHLGDFCFKSDSEIPFELISCLNGRHIFIEGSHDDWIYHLKRAGVIIYQTLTLSVNDIKIINSHYAHATWPKSHYGSFHAYGHSHNKYINSGKSFDVGVDGNNMTPVSLQTFFRVMSNKPNNMNLKIS